MTTIEGAAQPQEFQAVSETSPTVELELEVRELTLKIGYALLYQDAANLRDLASQVNALLLSPEWQAKKEKDHAHYVRLATILFPKASELLNASARVDQSVAHSSPSVDSSVAPSLQINPLQGETSQPAPVAQPASSHEAGASQVPSAAAEPVQSQLAPAETPDKRAVESVSNAVERPVQPHFEQVKGIELVPNNPDFLLFMIPKNTNNGQYLVLKDWFREIAKSPVNYALDTSDQPGWCGKYGSDFPFFGVKIVFLDHGGKSHRVEMSWKKWRQLQKLVNPKQVQQAATQESGENRSAQPARRKENQRPVKQERVEQQESVSVAVGTDKGKERDKNEDSAKSLRVVLRDESGRPVSITACVVADGMGGHQAGEVASQMAVQQVLNQPRMSALFAEAPTYGHSSTQERLQYVATALTKEANLAVFNASQDQSKQGMGTTVEVMLLADGGELALAHVGDSRTYLFRRGELKQITRDHSWVEDQVAAGVLTAEQARTHSYRNVITNALGHKQFVTPDPSAFQLSPGDVVIQCSDGLTGVVSDAEISQIIKGCNGNLEGAKQQLINLANDHGGPDNISVILTRFN